MVDPKNRKISIEGILETWDIHGDTSPDVSIGLVSIGTLINKYLAENPSLVAKSNNEIKQARGAWRVTFEQVED